MSSVEAEAEVTPDKGLVLESLDCLPLDAYLLALSRTVQARDITHISRTAEGVLVFLSDSRAAGALALAGALQVAGQRASCRRYTPHACRLLLTNCLPFIKDALVLAELRKLGQVFSPLRTEPVQSSLLNFRHVLSFSKTVTMVLNDHKKMPDKLVVQFRGTDIPIFIHVCDPCAWADDHIKVKPNKSEQATALRPAVSLGLWQHPTAAGAGASVRRTAATGK